MTVTLEQARAWVAQVKDDPEALRIAAQISRALLGK